MMTCHQHRWFSDPNCPACNTNAIKSSVDAASKRSSAQAASQHDEAMQLQAQAIAQTRAALERQVDLGERQLQHQIRASYALWVQTDHGRQYVQWREGAVDFLATLLQHDEAMQQAMTRDIEQLNRTFPEPPPRTLRSSQGALARAVDAVPDSRRGHGLTNAVARRAKPLITGDKVLAEWVKRRAAHVRWHLQITDPRLHDGTDDDFLVWTNPPMRRYVEHVVDFIQSAAETLPSPGSYPKLGYPRPLEFQPDSYIGRQLRQYHALIASDH